ncbi:MAG: ABC transporter transmembrane domain-containing protein, partial [Pseudomonadota bacterium]
MAKSRKSKIPIDRNTWPLVKRIVREHLRPHLGRVAFSLACMAIVAGATAALAKLMEPLMDGAFKDGDLQTLYALAAITLGVFVAKGIAAYGQEVMMNFIGQRIIADIQIRMFGHLIRSDLAFFHNNSTGKLISRFTNDVNMMRAAVSNALTGFGRELLTIVLLIGLMFYQDWLLACVAIFVFPVAILPIVRIGRRLRKVSANTQQEMGEFTTLLDESFQGARVVKAYGMEPYETRRATDVIDRIFRLVYKAARTKAAASPIMETLGG